MATTAAVSTPNAGGANPLPSQVSPGGPIAPAKTPTSPLPVQGDPTIAGMGVAQTPEQIAAHNAAVAAAAKPPAIAGGGPAPTIPVANTSAGATPISVPPPTQPSPTIDQQISTLQGGPNSTVTTAQGTVNDSLKEIQALLAKEGTKDSATSAAERAAGIPDMEAKANDIQTQIESMTAAARSASLLAENRLAPTFAISGEQAAIARQLSAQTLGLSAALDAIKGNETVAQAKVTAAIAAEFDPLTSEVAAAQAMLTANRDNLTAAQKAQADQINNLLTQRNQDLTQARSDKTDVYNTMTAAAKNGAPASVLTKISATANGADALKAAGNYMVSPKTTSVSDDKQTAFDTLTNIVASNYGGKMLPNGKPVLDIHGFITPEALQYFISQAPTEKLTAADVVTTLSPYIYTEGGTISPNYKLNVALSKLVNAAPQ